MVKEVDRPESGLWLPLVGCKDLEKSQTLFALVSSAGKWAAGPLWGKQLEGVDEAPSRAMSCSCREQLFPCDSLASVRNPMQTGLSKKKKKDFSELQSLLAE